MIKVEEFEIYTQLNYFSLVELGQIKLSDII